MSEHPNDITRWDYLAGEPNMNIVCEFGRFKTHQRNQKMHTFLIYFILFNVCIINNWKIQADIRVTKMCPFWSFGERFCGVLAGEVPLRLKLLPVVGSWQY